MKFFKTKKAAEQLKSAESMLPVPVPVKAQHHFMKVEETIMKIGRGPFKKTVRMKTVTEIVEN
jgi:hypothetical protein